MKFFHRSKLFSINFKGVPLTSIFLLLSINLIVYSMNLIMDHSRFDIFEFGLLYTNIL